MTAIRRLPIRLRLVVVGRARHAEQFALLLNGQARFKSDKHSSTVFVVTFMPSEQPDAHAAPAKLPRMGTGTSSPLFVLFAAHAGASPARRAPGR
jgi:hypothetical protein